jgi:hypothetical protein
MKPTGCGNHQGMRNLMVLAITCAAASAVASPCEVNLAHASEEVRAVIMQWVDKETRCGGPLEVRVVPTEGGLYLFARDERGRVRERLVPDATAAGVLVASWMVDDSVAQTDGVDVHVDVHVTGPLQVSVAPPPVAIAELPPPPPRVAEQPPSATSAEPLSFLGVSPSLMVAPFLGINSGGTGTGVRGELDLFRLGHWRLGVTASLEQGKIQFTPHPLPGMIVGELGFDTSEVKALGYLVRTFQLGTWELRPELAVGVKATTYHVVEPGNSPLLSDLQGNAPLLTKTDYNGSGATAELGVLLFHHIGADWDIGGGVIADLGIASQLLGENGMSVILYRSPELQLALGIRRRL